MSTGSPESQDVEIVEMDEVTSRRVAAESAQSGWCTPGCDCGHDGMGPTWHAANCTWRPPAREVT